jgi:hypothetical protein
MIDMSGILLLISNDTIPLMIKHMFLSVGTTDIKFFFNTKRKRDVCAYNILWRVVRCSFL